MKNLPFFLLFYTIALLPTGIFAQTISTLTGDGIAGYSGDGKAAAGAQLFDPFAVCVDTSGNVYVADFGNYVIRKITASTGIISTIAGNGIEGYTGDSGAATRARLNFLMGVAVDDSGNVYIADSYNNVIRKVTAFTGIITTLAGNGTYGYSGDSGAATDAHLADPISVAVDTSGNVYFADYDFNVIRKVTHSTGIISTLAGNGTKGYSGDSGAAVGAQLNNPTGVCLDASGNIYVADEGNNCIRKISFSTGIISTVAGTGTLGYSIDGQAATSAALYDPWGVSTDASGNLYIADQGSNRIRKVTAATGIISTIAGNGIIGYSGDSGAATNAELNYPKGVVTDRSGNVYIADYGNNVIRKVSVIPPPPPDTIFGNTTLCSGSTHTYRIPAETWATSYTWTLPPGWTGTSTDTSISVTVDSTGGIISVRANNSAGSSAAQSLPITVLDMQAPAAPGRISGDTLVYADSTYTYSIMPVSDAGSYTWILPVGWSGTSTTDSILVTPHSGSGIITVRADNFCGSSLAAILNIQVRTKTGIEEITNYESGIKIYPNPTKDIFNVQSSILKVQSIELYTLFGFSPKVGLKNSLPLGGSGWVIDLSSMPPGMYFIKITTNEGSVVKKIVKE